jgi:hypothetical protein
MADESTRCFGAPEMNRPSVGPPRPAGRWEKAGIAKNGTGAEGRCQCVRRGSAAGFCARKIG